MEVKVTVKYTPESDCYTNAVALNLYCCFENSDNLSQRGG